MQAASAASSALAAGSGAVRLDATAAPFAETIHLISSPTRYKDNTLANQIEKALEKEFPDDRYVIPVVGLLCMPEIVFKEKCATV